MLRNLSFRSRLVLVVSVPLLVLVVFAGFMIKDRFDALAAEQQYGNVVVPFQALTRVARTVGDESLVVADPATPTSKVTAARRDTVAAAAALRAALPQLEGQVSSTTVRAAQHVADGLDGLSDTGAYSSVGAAALSAASAVARDVDDRTLSTSLGAVVSLERKRLAVADGASAVMRHLAGRSADLDAWLTALSEQAAQARLFAESASSAERAAYERVAAPEVNPDPVRVAAGTALPRAFPTVSTTTADYGSWYRTNQAALDHGVTAVQAVINDEADVRQSETRGEAIVVALGTAAVIWAALILVWALMRSVSRRLRALTRSAREVSERRLPLLVDTLQRGGDVGPDTIGDLSPIRSDANDEIGDLAKAFNTIQEVTVTVAREQAEMVKKGIGDLYVNLARRNQSLVDRQIALLDDLEANADPDELAALFELDHLATRMRRNAESLLVLSGAEQPRQWGSSIAVVDVVRAAAAEIADFARLHAFGFDGDITIAGHAVADLTHLLAELLENATAFSPPGTPVTVGGRLLDGRFVITVSDEGIGMDDARLGSANELLAQPPMPGLALSRTLGLHVVAHLAARHGIRVQLLRAEPTGVTALVVIPASLLGRAGEPDTRVAEPTAGPPAVAEVVDEETAPEPAPEHEPAPDGREPLAEPEPVAASVTTVAAPATEPPSTNGNGNGHASTKGNGVGLAARVPGTNLTHRPSPTAPPVEGELRPRPERVQDLLSRHERGKRDGHGKGRE
jgi:signal transduction histidine kinase